MEIEQKGLHEGLHIIGFDHAFRRNVWPSEHSGRHFFHDEKKISAYMSISINRF